MFDSVNNKSPADAGLESVTTSCGGGAYPSCLASYRLDSVAPADAGSTEQAKKDKIVADKKAKDKPAIDAITEAIEQGVTLKKELIKTACEDSGVSRRTLIKALDDYTGCLWRLSVGEKGAKSYHLLTTFQASAQDYSFFKDGE